MLIPGNADAALAPVKIGKISGRKARSPNFRGREDPSPSPVRPAVVFSPRGVVSPVCRSGFRFPGGGNVPHTAEADFPVLYADAVGRKDDRTGGSFRKRERIAVGLSAGTFGSAMLSARTLEIVVGKCLRKTERSELDGFAVRRVAETVFPACPFCGRIAAGKDSGVFERRVAECSEKDRNDLSSTDERSRFRVCLWVYDPQSSLCRRRYAVRVMLPVRDGWAARIVRFGCGHRTTTLRFRTSLTGPIM